ncbi:CorA metal ion transporter [Quaeritorhiza haematococci]|nr:CorA metal ion transporter [Quaeritorhiza haematococci]
MKRFVPGRQKTRNNSDTLPSQSTTESSALLAGVSASSYGLPTSPSEHLLSATEEGHVIYTQFASEGPALTHTTNRTEILTMSSNNPSSNLNAFSFFSHKRRRSSPPTVNTDFRRHDSPTSLATPSPYQAGSTGTPGVAGDASHRLRSPSLAVVGDSARSSQPSLASEMVGSITEADLDAAAAISFSHDVQYLASSSTSSTSFGLAVKSTTPVTNPPSVVATRPPLYRQSQQQRTGSGGDVGGGIRTGGNLGPSPSHEPSQTSISSPGNVEGNTAASSPSRPSQGSWSRTGLSPTYGHQMSFRKVGAGRTGGQTASSAPAASETLNREPPSKLSSSISSAPAQISETGVSPTNLGSILTITGNEKDHEGNGNRCGAECAEDGPKIEHLISPEGVSGLFGDESNVNGEEDGNLQGTQTNGTGEEDDSGGTKEMWEEFHRENLDLDLIADYLSGASSLPQVKMQSIYRKTLGDGEPRYMFYSEVTGPIRADNLDELNFKHMDKPVSEILKSAHFWINVCDPTHGEINLICKIFGVHPLTAEDIQTHDTREKCEVFPCYYFIVIRSFDENPYSLTYLQPINVYLIVFKNCILTFQPRPTPHANNVLRRISQLKTYGLHVTSDWINYAIIDDITDSFMPLLRHIELEVDSIDDLVLILKESEQSDMLRRIGHARKKVLLLLRLLSTKADVLRTIIKRCGERMAPGSETCLYLGDIQDHAITMIQNLSHYEKTLARSHSTYLAQISIEITQASNRTNDVAMKVSALASILLPLNVITGLWGMNVRVPGQDEESLFWFGGICVSMVAIAGLTYWLVRKFQVL